jgi:catechol 2,3-dioxygenase-like lactoylglutathione lyase family enzyme
MNLNQVTLPSTDVERSAAFYRLLGFTQIVSSLPDYVRFECRDGGSTFSLHAAASAVAPGVVVYFECEDLDAEYRMATSSVYIMRARTGDFRRGELSRRRIARP